MYPSISTRQLFGHQEAIFEELRPLMLPRVPPDPKMTSKLTPKLRQKRVQEGPGGGLEEGLLKKVPTLSSTHYYPYKQQVSRVEKASFLEALGP